MSGTVILSGGKNEFSRSRHPKGHKNPMRMDTIDKRGLFLIRGMQVGSALSLKRSNRDAVIGTTYMSRFAWPIESCNHADFSFIDKNLLSF